MGLSNGNHFGTEIKNLSDNTWKQSKWACFIGDFPWVNGGYMFFFVFLFQIGVSIQLYEYFAR